jgi:drug/metabolite transporter (DMT)-like permease
LNFGVPLGPLTATVGWLVYSERLDALTLVGAALILAGNLVNLRPPQARPVALGSSAGR